MLKPARWKYLLPAAGGAAFLVAAALWRSSPSPYGVASRRDEAATPPAHRVPPSHVSPQETRPPRAGPAAWTRPAASDFHHEVLSAEARLAPLLHRLYFACEAEDPRTFKQTERYQTRKRELLEALERCDGPAGVAAILLLVAKNEDKIKSSEYLLSELHGVIAASDSLRAGVASRAFLDFLELHLVDPGHPPHVRAFMASVAAIHAREFLQRRPEEIPASSARLTAATLVSACDVLVEAIGADRKRLARELLALTGSYLGLYSELREAYARLAAHPPDDPDLRRALALVLAAQKWPVYDIPTIFDFMLGAMDPAQPRLFAAVVEAFSGTPLLKGDDPRALRYFGRLSTAYRQVDAEPSTGRDLREPIVHALLELDVQGAPTLVCDYLTKADVPPEIKALILRQIVSKAQAGSYTKTKGELFEAMRSLKVARGNDPEQAELIEECLNILAR